ncbi:MerR family transcriptional regulator [Rahnella sp. SAP-1]|uniref:MerR family transcriptional regulator n=1 Tax=Rouxiella aceris TaxID=2703884 RepID=A0A848MJZ2_9GAMM|nr:MerR family transcriptional regulator [Rouxiella aceris]NMP27431.1 MerR family transcriptional regulator [Rouxiella aceris]
MTTLIYSIQKFAVLSGISEYNLRYFDQIDLLPARRSANGYRVYHQEQIAIARMITILQSARLSNAQIKTLLKNYTLPQGMDILKQAQQQLTAYIDTLQLANSMIAAQIDQIEMVQTISKRLDTPFIEDNSSVLVGVITLDTQDIGDFFKTVIEHHALPDWYLHYRYGFLLAAEQIQATGYPLVSFYCDEPNIIAYHSQHLPAGRYLSQYSAGSLENNQQVWTLLQYAKRNDYQLRGDILIENVSGPAIQSKKSDFLIKIMLPIN